MHKIFGILLLLMTVPAIDRAWTLDNFLSVPGLGTTAEKEIFEAKPHPINVGLSKEIGPAAPKSGSTLQRAVTTLGSNPTILNIPAGKWDISANLTFPVNITFKPEPGAILHVAAGKTLTIAGPIAAGPYQIFSWTGSGAIVLGPAVNQVYAEWFGADPSGSTFSTRALDKVLAGHHRNLVLLPGATYKVATINLANIANITIKGSGGAKIKLSGGARNNAIQIGNSCREVIISEVVFEGDGLSDSSQAKGYGVYVNGTNIADLTIKNCRFRNFGNGGIKIAGMAVDRVQVQGNFFADNGDNANGSADITFYISGVKNALISENQCLSSNDLGIFVTPQSAGTNNILIANNIAKNHRRHGIDVYADGSPAGSDRINISNNYTENNGWCGIYVNCSGANHGSIVVNGNISHKDSTAVYPGSGVQYAAIEVANDSVNGKPVTVANNLIEAPQRGNSGIVIQAKGHALVANNQIVNGTGIGIKNTTSIDKVIIIGNVIENCAGTAISLNPCGDYVTIATNNITTNGQTGIDISAEVKPGKYTKVTGNSIINTGAPGATVGIGFRTGTPNLFDISGNTVSGFDKNIYIYNSGQAHGKVQNNLVSNAASYGIYNYAREVDYSGNVYYKNMNNFTNAEWHSPANVRNESAQ